MKNTFLGLACLLAVSLGLSALAVKAEVQESSAEAPRDNANAWSFDIVPYLWLAGYDGTVGLPNLPAGIPEVPTESRFWVDPILGASLRYDLTRHWYGTVLGDVGGFGVGSDISWSVFGGVGYQFTDWLSVTLGYRYLHIDYDKDQFVMNGNVQGFLLGLGFHF
jgi:hypothetical protein